MRLIAVSTCKDFFSIKSLDVQYNLLGIYKKHLQVGEFIFIKIKML